MLSELEDRILAMSSGDWIDLETGVSIIESWFNKRIDLYDLETLLARLIDAGLLRVRFNGELQRHAPELNDVPLSEIDIIATEFGELYLTKVPPAFDGQ